MYAIRSYYARDAAVDIGQPLPERTRIIGGCIIDGRDQQFEIGAGAIEVTDMSQGLLRGAGRNNFV